MRIAIVDDMASERSQLREKLEHQLARCSVYADIFEFDSGEAFLTATKEEAFTAAFLDIYMHGMNGIVAAKELRNADTDCILIFTTTSEDHALEGFRVRALHYLVKPYTEEEIQSVMEEILRRIDKPDKYITVKALGGNVCLRFQNILYAEHYSHQMRIAMLDGTTAVTRQSFSEFSALFREDERFFVCSRGTLVNLEHADDFDGSAFLMCDGKAIGVSRDLLKTARQAFMDCLFRKENA